LCAKHGIFKAPLFVNLEIPLSPDSGPIFRQTYLWLRRAIAVGDLRPGERLPSTRDLSGQLGVSRTVTLLAYDQLMAEGFIEGRAGSGTYVSRGITTRRDIPPAPPAKLKLSRFGLTAADAALRLEFPAKSPLRYDFSYGRSAVGEFPFEQWRRILIRKSRQAPARSFDYGPSAGSIALREAIAAHLRRSRAVVCDASQVIIVNGSQQALDLTARVLLEPGDHVAIEDPSYQGAREVFRAAAAKLFPVPVDAEGLIPSKLPKVAKLAFVTPSHQFPTGTVLPLSRRLALLQWAKRTGAVVIEDDYDGEFRYAGQPVESMQGLDAEGRVLYIGTFSRTVFPALRIGYMIAPKLLAPALVAAKWLCDRHTATLEQETLAEFIETGAYERHLRRARRANALRLQALLDAIQKYIGDRASITGAGSGTHLVLWPNQGPEESELVAQAAACGVGVYGISPYYMKPNVKAGLLLGFARLTQREIREGIRQLAPLVACPLP
jgi:GntR family transcriptional regulator / MocR family aminotransferase